MRVISTLSSQLSTLKGRPLESRLARSPTKAHADFLPMPGIASSLFFGDGQRVKPHFYAGDGACTVAGDHHAGLGFKRNLVFHAHQNGVGSDLPSKGDAGFPVNLRGAVEFRFVNRQTGSPVVGLPVNVVNDLTQRKQFFQERLVDPRLGTLF